MTYEEAIELLGSAVCVNLTYERVQAITMLIDAAKLQVAKKVETMEGGCGRKVPICPSCECLLEEYEIARERCCECGQLLDTEDWSEE